MECTQGEDPNRQMQRVQMAYRTMIGAPARNAAVTPLYCRSVSGSFKWTPLRSWSSERRGGAIISQRTHNNTICSLQYEYRYNFVKSSKLWAAHANFTAL